MAKKILIVEDNEINRELLSAILAEAYQVLEAENGQVALDILKTQKDSVSLILLDVMMPVMDGYTFLNHVKADAELSLIPVIVMTQGNSEADELAALAHGATDFLTKPYRPEIILHRIAGLIKLRETAAMVNQLQYDRLTGLYSKEYFYQKVRERLSEDPEGSYCIIGSNIENFKLINDAFGMGEGDRLLKETAEIALQMAGEDGFCGRLSGDRFLCFQKWNPEQTQQKNFGSVEDGKISHLVKSVVMRWGIYEITDRSTPVEQMCERAQLAADSIKRQYNRYIALYDDSLRSKMIREQKITAAMETAVQEHQFTVYLQPKYSLQDNCMTGSEALVRWIHPQWGFMSPGEFIPLFEKNGFISKLDFYVWEQVLICLRKWKDQGYPLLPVSVNVSRADVIQGNLADIIYALTQKYGIAPAWLHLEITESAYTENPDQLISTVEALRKKGFVVEMDDFGSGYSSLNMLSQMPMDILKLDMKFVQNELAKSPEQSFLSNIISMAHRACMDVVAEGVETREQMNRLRALGCDYAQGYFFAKPMPVGEYEALLKNWKPQKVSRKEERHPVFQANILLVVDENANYRRLIRNAFEEQYHVLEASNGEEVLDYIQSGVGDSVLAAILSMTLPENDSALVFKALRQSPAFWEIPVLATIPSGECMQNVPLALEADDFLCKCHPMFDMRRRVQRMIDMATFHRKERVLEDAASHDALTGLLNRRGFQDAITAMQSKDVPMAICLFDVDGLKAVNDTYGHAMGDKMLRCFADVLCHQTRLDDIKCRYGGDEFLLVLQQLPSAEVAMKKGTTICRMFGNCESEIGFPTACSAGIVMCEPGEKRIAELIAHADEALYQAKRTNRGGCCLWQSVAPAGSGVTSV